MNALQKHMNSLIKKHGGIRPAARALGISPTYILRLRSGERSATPSPEMLEKLGLVATTTFKRAKRS